MPHAQIGCSLRKEAGERGYLQDRGGKGVCFLAWTEPPPLGHTVAWGREAVLSFGTSNRSCCEPRRVGRRLLTQMQVIICNLESFDPVVFRIQTKVHE